MHTRNIATKGNDSSEDSQRKMESWRESFHLFREYINNHQRNVSRNMDCEGHSGEISMLLDSGEKAILVIKCPENLAEIYSSVLWKIKLASYEIR